MGIYKHPYKRGFALEAVCDGFLHLSFLVWKWELWANVHSIGPGIDHVKKHWEAAIDAAKDAETKAKQELKDSIYPCTWGDY
jgi:hypothetical protein